MQNAEKFHRRSIRLSGYDYATAGAYFVTICAKNRRPVFGSIANGILQNNAYGAVVRGCWQAMPHHFPFVLLDECVVMPNHFHAILIFNRSLPDESLVYSSVEAQYCCVSTPVNVEPGSLGALMRSFKSAVTREVNLYRHERGLAPVQVWQRNYHERIIRSERELDGTRRYVRENPQHWPTDKNNPSLKP